MELNPAMVEQLTTAVASRVMEQIGALIDSRLPPRPTTPDTVRSWSSGSSSSGSRSPSTPVARPREDVPPRKRRRSGRLDIPKQCQTAVRMLMSEMMKLEENPIVISYDSYDDNAAAMDRVVREAKRIHRGRPWLNEANLKEACKKVWRNKRDDHNRRLNNKKDEHRAQVAKNNRAQAKLVRRLQEVNKSGWSEDKKRKWRQGLRKEVMSPEKTSRDDAGTRIAMPHEWRSEELQRGLKILDESYIGHLNPQGKSRRSRVITSEEQTRGPPPAGTPSWMISPKYVDGDLEDAEERSSDH